ncbi:hypothetical protein H7171_00825 [Candidatus Saccharibacteria bacterium]|nr:hypothetical protein [Candidatus Saccharibacteria bacterium]
MSPKSIEVACWNVAKGLGLPPVESNIYEGIKSFDADFIFLSEGYATGNGDSKYWKLPQDEIDGRIRDFAAAEGYNVAITNYDDTDKTRTDVPSNFEQYAVLLTRPRFNMNVTQVRLGTRNALRAVVELQCASPMPIYGAHFDDRTTGAREGMAQAFLEDVAIIAHQENKPIDGLSATLAGDLNVMHSKSISARLTGSSLFNAAAEHAPVKRVKSLGTRLHEMANGNLLNRLEKAGFSDAHPLRQPTFRFAGLPLVQLDHIMTRGVYAVNPERLKQKGSDHDALTVTIYPTAQ